MSPARRGAAGPVAPRPAGGPVPPAHMPVGRVPGGRVPDGRVPGGRVPGGRVPARCVPAALVGAALVVAGAGGCVGPASRGEPPAPPPYADCAALPSPPRAVPATRSPTGDPPPDARAPGRQSAAAPAPGAAPPSGAAPAAAAGTSSAVAGRGGGPVVGRPLADVPLSCLTGGSAVATGALAGPAVVSLWATWCPPCREELPVLQRFADRTPGVHVVGVVTEDRPDWAADLGRELGLRFPQLVDAAGALRRAVGAPGLPATVLLGADGTVRHVQLRPLTDAALADLADRHLGGPR